MPMLWRNVLSSSSDFATTGYKVAAYVHLISFGPYAFMILPFWLTLGNDLFVEWLVSAMRFSVMGPWFLNFYALYVIGKTSVPDLSALQIAAATAYAGYSLLTMILQKRMTPKIMAYSLRNAPY